MLMCRYCLGSALRGLIALVLLWMPAAAQATAASEPEPERIRTLIHVLDYVAADYPGAVRDGVVISELEYGEMVQFAVIADSLVRELVADGTLQAGSGLVEAALRLTSEIGDRAEPDVIVMRARMIRDLVVSVSGIAVAPTTWPDASAGGNLYRTYCVVCHGDGGRGDGPGAASLDPRPANLAQGERIAGLAPFQVFNTVRLGVEGTGMAGFPQLTEQEVWDIAFFVKSLRGAGMDSPANPEALRSLATLEEISSRGDHELATLLAAREVTNAEDVAVALRGLAPPSSGAGTLDLAGSYLDDALAAYRAGDARDAQTLAIRAYLEGVEPVEPMLRAADAGLVAEVEEAMMAVRGAIHGGSSAADVERSVRAAQTAITEARGALGGGGTSAWFTFGLALSILLREALEAFLVIITILGLIRVSDEPRAARWVHAGWLGAVLVGLAGWFLVDMLIRMSAAGRELLEGGIALFAVVVLLSMGYWLHDKSSTRKWTAFVDRRVRRELGRGSLVGLAAFSFFVVFREAFESVLFLSALSLDGGRYAASAIGGAAVVTLVAVLVAGFLAVRYSARIPVRHLFRYASLVVVVLAVVLTGKGVHALQEAGMMQVSLTGLSIRLELLGIYPTAESIIAQLAVSGTVILLWALSRRLEVRALQV